MNILIVYNPNAGKGNAFRHAQKIEQELNRAAASTAPANTLPLKITLFAANGLDVMNKFWRENKQNPNKFDTAVLIGGDGTLGPNVDAMLQNGLSIPVYAYGKGTANDFATYFKTNCSAKKAAQAILQNKITEVDTIKVYNNTEKGTYTYAVNVVCGGAFTNGVTRYNKKSKRLFGKFAYLLHAFFSAFTMKSQLMQFTVVTLDDGSTEHFDADVFLFYILNTKHVGGLKNSAPLADPADGLLDLVCIKRCGPFGKLAIKVNQSLGRLHKCKHITCIKGKSFHIEPVKGYEIKPNFTLTDIDGNAANPYPLNAELGPKIKVIIR